jgi:hypothetical protein
VGEKEEKINADKWVNLRLDSLKGMFSLSGFEGL